MGSKSPRACQRFGAISVEKLGRACPSQVEVVYLRCSWASNSTRTRRSTSSTRSETFASALNSRPQQLHRDEMSGKASEGTGWNETILICGSVVQPVRTPTCHAAGLAVAPANSSNRRRICLFKTSHAKLLRGFFDPPHFRPSNKTPLTRRGDRKAVSVGARIFNP